ncbi:MAG: hypothetical protein IKH98_04685 [Candidatus Methanomethylophilaceae archaeon]|nr:hypothetical protein [Candidatus Methanomethylophilaceae archaeon]
MTEKIRFPCELSLLCGLLLVAFAVCLFIQSGYGVTVISSIPLTVSYAFPALDFGTWNIVYQLVLVCMCLAVTRKPDAGYAFSIIVTLLFGIFLNFMKSAMSGLPRSTELDLLYIVVAHVLLFFGVSFFMRCYLPLLPVDLFIRDVVITFKIRYRLVKTAFDLTCIAISAAVCLLCLGEIVDLGAGTLVSAFITGYFVTFITTRVYDKIFEFVPATRMAKRLLSADAPCRKAANDSRLRLENRSDSLRFS